MIDSGVAGVRFEVGDHICAFYEGDAGRDALLAPYLDAGLRAGDSCVAVLDGVRPEEFQRELSEEAEPNQLGLVSSDDAYLVDGRFDTERMLAFWEERVGAALAGDAFDFSRAAGEMTWSSRDAPGVDELVGYESKLNEFLPRYPQIILCLYDVARLDAATVIGMVRTHPRLILGGDLVVNPYYQTSGAYLASRDGD